MCRGARHDLPHGRNRSDLKSHRHALWRRDCPAPVQATGMEAGKAGNAVQFTIFMGICVGYISTYIFRVANKARSLLPATFHPA